MRTFLLFWYSIALGSQPAISAPSSRYSRNANSFQGLLPNSTLARDGSDDDGVTKHFDIVRMAAIGDSYSAGIGAGNRLGGLGDLKGYLCNRFDGSYPWLVHTDESLGDPATRNFQFASCSGALATEVVRNQIPGIQGNQQVILLSAGGSDIGLTKIMNQCVYQWLALTPWQAALAKVADYGQYSAWVKNFDFDSTARGCDPQLDDSELLVTSDEFAATLDSLSQAAMSKLGPGWVSLHTHITISGDTKFEAEATSIGLDTPSSSQKPIHHNAILFRGRLGFMQHVSAFQDNVYLTSDRRKRMNNLVHELNSQIEAAVQRAGSAVTFIDYDHHLGEFGDRFCEAGVDESAFDSGMRVGMLFYQHSTQDPFGLSPWTRSEGSPAEGTFEGDLGSFAMLNLRIDPTAQLATAGKFQETQAGPVKIETVNAAVEAGTILNPLPDGYGRTFHPQKLLHQLIAHTIICHMTNQESLDHGLSAIDGEYFFDLCPFVQTGDLTKCFLGKSNTAPPSTFVQRILPLGASIVWGERSSTGDGFREDLREMIVNAGGHVNYVGSRQSGTMDDCDVEATPGAIITDVQRYVERSLPYKPNVVLISAGTNDCTQGIDVAHAHLRMGAIIDKILSAIPGVVVILSTLIVNGLAPGNVAVYNANLKTMVAARKASGQRVTIVDMQGPDGPVMADVDGDPAKTHANDAGYQKMANVFWKGFQEVYSLCWLSPPLDSGISDNGTGGKPDTTCEKSLANVQGPTCKLKISGTKDDGPYIHVAVPKGLLNVPVTVASGVNNHGIHDAAGLYWADMDGDGFDDCVWVGNNTVMGVSRNYGLKNGMPTFGTYAESKQPGYCLRSGVRFGDVNGDGRDDFFCLGPTGLLQGWLNTPSSDQALPNWTPMGDLKQPSGYNQESIRLADIDGDGRVDYVALTLDASTVTARAWRNAGQGDKPTSFDDLGVVMQISIAQIGLPKPLLKYFQFVDLNGDGRDDFLVVLDDGAVWTWINHRGYDVGLAPSWIAMGQTSTGSGINVKSAATVIHGKVMGTMRHDFTHVYDKLPKDFYPAVDLYANEGSKGLFQKGDGCRYCDMRGTGADDYIWMRSDGAIHLFGNRHEPPFWDDLGDLPFPFPEWTKSRKDIHLADIDGDGKCDYIWVDPLNNEFTVFLNVWTESGGFKWGPPSRYSAYGSSDLAGTIGIFCTNHYNYYQFDYAVRFADIDGDGRADYLCVDKDGRVTGALSHGKGTPTTTSAGSLPAAYVSAGQIKLAEGADRSSIHFADINGDGKADYLWVNKLDGSVKAWTNQGGGTPPTAGGSSFKWGNAGGLVDYGRVARGETISYGNIKGLDRADLIVVHADTAVADTYFNVCPGGKGPMPTLPPLPGCTVC